RRLSTVRPDPATLRNGLLTACRRASGRLSGVVGVRRDLPVIVVYSGTRPMKRPERPAALFAVLVAVVALLVPSSVANAAPTANGDAVSADKAASAGKAKKADTEEKSDPPKDPSKLRSQLSDLSDDYKKAADRLGALEKKQKALSTDIRETSARLEKSRSRVAQTAQAAYTSGNVDSTVVALTSHKDADDVIDQM